MITCSCKREHVSAWSVAANHLPGVITRTQFGYAVKPTKHGPKLMEAVRFENLDATLVAVYEIDQLWRVMYPDEQWVNLSTDRARPGQTPG